MRGQRMETGNAWRGVSTSGRELTKATEKLLTTEHQGVGGQNSEEMPL